MHPFPNFDAKLRSIVSVLAFLNLVKCNMFQFLHKLYSRDGSQIERREEKDIYTNFSNFNR